MGLRHERLLSRLGLNGCRLFVYRCGVVPQVLIVENGVEDQSLGSDGLAAIDGVIAEQQHVPLAIVGVYYYGMFRNR